MYIISYAIKVIPFQIMKFNLISLHDEIRSMKDAIKFAQERNILKKSTKCKTCARTCKIQYNDAKDNYKCFRCHKCNTKESIRKDTFLYNKVCYKLINISDISIEIYEYFNQS